MHDSEDTEDGQKIHGDYLRVPDSGNSTNRFGNGYDNDTGGSLGINHLVNYNYKSRQMLIHPYLRTIFITIDYVKFQIELFTRTKRKRRET